MFYCLTKVLIETKSHPRPRLNSKKYHKNTQKNCASYNRHIWPNQIPTQFIKRHGLVDGQLEKKLCRQLVTASIVNNFINHHNRKRLNGSTTRNQMKPFSKQQKLCNMAYIYRKYIKTKMHWTNSSKLTGQKGKLCTSWIDSKINRTVFIQ